MLRKSFFWTFILLSCLLIASLACNFSSDVLEPTSPPQPTATIESVPTIVPTKEKKEETAVLPLEDSLTVTNLEGVKQATIQIEAQGTFVDPQVGLQMNVPGRGSGFIIDESGIALTNNHVVTGAGLLRVWVGGESEPRNARVLAISECSDLAMIDIDGDGYHYLSWYEGSINPGLDIYAAGFPLGDPEFTLTRGIVSKENADGETDWASVDSVIEHDATINPGNSGGPLVTENGQVVAVNYAGSQDTNQYFAISQTEVLSIIDKLKQEIDVTSIGVNGMAVNDGEGVTGIWVSSVESGSAADQAGVKGGDIITMIENIPLATDGTMSDYCDILRSHSEDDTMSIQVLRYDTEEVLEGQINGTTLEHAFSFAQALGDEVAQEPPSNTNDSIPMYNNYTAITDNSGSITMEVPSAWSDIDGSLWEESGEILGASLVASNNIDDFMSYYDVPGVAFFASEALADSTLDDLLALGDFNDDCLYEGRQDYEDVVYTGAFDLYSNCGGSESIIIVLAAYPEDYSYASLLLIQALTEADLTAVDHILETFVVVDELPGDTTTNAGTTPSNEVMLEILNNTSEDIWYIYISPSTSDSWGEDWLDQDILASNGSYYFTLPPGIYDLRAANDEDLTINELYEVDLTNDQTWTLFDESSNGSDSNPTQLATLEIINTSYEPIWYVYISPSTSDEWGDDWLMESIIYENEVFTITLPPGIYDLRAADDEGISIEEIYESEIVGDMTWTVTGD